MLSPTIELSVEGISKLDSLMSLLGSLDASLGFGSLGPVVSDGGGIKGSGGTKDGA